MGYSYWADEYYCLAGQLEEKVQGFLRAIDDLLRNAAYSQALSFAHKLYTNSCITTEIAILNNLYEIYLLEYQAGKPGVFDNRHSYRELTEFYFKVKFILRRLGNSLISPEDAVEYFVTEHISKEALNVIASHSLLYEETLLVEKTIKSMK